MLEHLAAAAGPSRKRPPFGFSAFMRVGFAGLAWDYQILNEFIAGGGDPKDAAALIKAFQAAENSHVVGYPPISCNDNAPQYQSVCKKSGTYAQWDGTKFTPDPAVGAGKFIDLTELLNSIPPRAS